MRESGLQLRFNSLTEVSVRKSRGESVYLARQEFRVSLRGFRIFYPNFHLDLPLLDHPLFLAEPLLHAQAHPLYRIYFDMDIDCTIYKTFCRMPTLELGARILPHLPQSSFSIPSSAFC